MKNKFLFRSVLILAAAFTISVDALISRGIAHAQAIEPQAASYGEVGGETLMLDVYQPTVSGTTFPAVILIHGGGGSYGDRGDLSAFAQALAEAGYVAFNIDYRLLTKDGSTTKNMWPAQLEDAQLAVRWVRANAAFYHVDPDQSAHLGIPQGDN